MRLRNYGLVTAGYWAFTISDGAMRMLVLLHFHDLGYSPLSIAVLFVLYEVMGIATNLLGGWVGSRTGLNRTLVAGLALQVASLGLLSITSSSWRTWASVLWVMAVQALSGIAKDLTKMSSKSAVKLFAGQSNGTLFRWVAILTGSKNALKGVGFFVGAALLSATGFENALWILALGVAASLAMVVTLLNEDIGKSRKKTPLRSVLSKSTAINRLSAARFFLFGARDLWFVVALPIFLIDELAWPQGRVGAFMAAWVIGYGIVQSFAPQILGGFSPTEGADDRVRTASRAAAAVAIVSAGLAGAAMTEVSPTVTIVVGLGIYGFAFALNSSLHSYLILAYADSDEVALDVGFYYSANAAGRLMGTLGSGALFLVGGLVAALVGSTISLALAWAISTTFEPLPDATANA